MILGTHPVVQTLGPLTIGVTGAIVIPVTGLLGAAATTTTKLRTRTVTSADVAGR